MPRPNLAQQPQIRAGRLASRGWFRDAKFSMFASDATRCDITDWTRYGRDSLKELADECGRLGIRLFFCFPLDRHHPDCFPRGRHGPRDRPE